MGPRELEDIETIGTQTTIAEAAKPTCKFFRLGNCIYGAKCKYLHAKDELTAYDTVKEPLEDEAKKDDFTRTIGGAFVQFSAGARTSQIRLSSDFSAARISGLQENTSKQSVQDMLAGKGFDVSIDDIYILHLQDGCGATVRSDDPTFSKRFCAIAQQGCTWKDARIQATQIAAPMPSGHNSRRVDCKKIHISWHKAVRTVWLTFGNARIANTVREMFIDGTCKVLGQKVTSPTTNRDDFVVFHPRSADKNPVACKVKLTEVPATAQEMDILQAIKLESNRPRHIVMGELSYLTDTEQATAMVRSLLTNIGPLEYWEVTLETNARRIKATARFLDESDARRAATELDKSKLPFHPKAQLTVQMVYSAKFKVYSNIYTAVQPRISAHQAAWKERNVSFKAYSSADPLRKFRILKIESESAKDVASAKTDLELILAGVVAMGRDNDAALWDSSLKANGKLYQMIKKMEKEFSVIILRDKAKSELRLFGDDSCCEEAQNRLVELIRIESMATTVRAIGLEPHKFFWACNGGFKKIAARLGPGKASFDIISTPKQISISGSLEDYDLALALVEGRAQFTEPVNQLGLNETAQDCSVCWTEADTPIKTKCGHYYCLECFESSCTQGGMAVADFTVLCHGNQGGCKAVIGIEDLQEHLSSAALEDVLERSFSSYIERNPNEFRYCPTPDCGYIYRANSVANTHTCSNCLRPTCSACHEPHIGMSCAEHRDLKSGGYEALQKLKKELGIKDCPKCKTPLEKVSGCNHMTCAACRAHICWVCLMTFPSGEEVYGHMSKCHGGHIDFPPL